VWTVEKHRKGKMSFMGKLKRDGSSEIVTSSSRPTPLAIYMYTLYGLKKYINIHLIKKKIQKESFGKSGGKFRIHCSTELDKSLSESPIITNNTVPCKRRVA